jgi:DNA-binding LacI/PurR family transcriptional regulator
MNIYHAVIVYPANFKNDEFIKEMHSKDYPIVEIDSSNVEQAVSLESRYRMFVVHSDAFNDYMKTKKDLSSVTILVCITDTVTSLVHQALQDMGHINMSEKLYIFSCNNV